MPDQRIKGQEVFVAVIIDGQLETRIDAVQSATITPKFEKLEEDYIGETTTRYDEIYKGVDVSLELHLTNQQAMILATAIRQRAKRRAGGATRIDVSGSFLFPGGDFPTLAIPDVFFEDIPFEVGGRSEYVNVTLTGSASDYELLT